MILESTNLVESIYCALYYPTPSLNTSSILFIGGTSLASDLPVINQLLDFEGGADMYFAALNSSSMYPVSPTSSLIICVDGSFLWGTYYGGPFTDKLYGIDVDNVHNRLIFCGETQSDYLATPNALYVNRTGESDGIIGSLDINNVASSPVMPFWITYFGTVQNDILQNVGVDLNGVIYVTGSAGTINFTQVTPMFSDNRTCFLLIFDLNGISLKNYVTRRCTHLFKWNHSQHKSPTPK